MTWSTPILWKNLKLTSKIHKFTLGKHQLLSQNIIYFSHISPCLSNKNTFFYARNDNYTLEKLVTPQYQVKYFYYWHPKHNKCQTSTKSNFFKMAAKAHNVGNIFFRRLTPVFLHIPANILKTKHILSRKKVNDSANLAHPDWCIARVMASLTGCTAVKSNKIPF